MTKQTQDGWSDRIAATVAEQVRRLRSERGMSAQQLSDATAQLGHPVKRSIIADMESGRRTVLPVADWLVLAAALDVPPVALMFPADAESAEPRPGVICEPAAAHHWISGYVVDPADGVTVRAKYQAARRDAAGLTLDVARRVLTDAWARNPSAASDIGMQRAVQQIARLDDLLDASGERVMTAADWILGSAPQSDEGGDDARA